MWTVVYILSFYLIYIIKMNNLIGILFFKKDINKGWGNGEICDLPGNAYDKLVPRHCSLQPKPHVSQMFSLSIDLKFSTFFTVHTSLSILQSFLLPWILFLTVSQHDYHVCCCCSVTESCPNLRGPTDHSILAFPSFTVSWSFLKFKSIELVMLSNTSSSALPSPPAFNLSQHPGLFQWVGSLHQVAKVLEIQLQHQSFQ